jgi:hypothetical protein
MCADAEYCESLLACIVESFAAAGENGKVRQLLPTLSVLFVGQDNIS